MPKCILCERPLTLFKCIKILFSRPGAPQSQQASLPGRFLRPEITARTSSCRPLSWNWSWSPPRAVFKASSLLFCSTDTHLREDKWRDYKKKTSIHINRWPFRYIRCIFNISMSFFILLFPFYSFSSWEAGFEHALSCMSVHAALQNMIKDFYAYGCVWAYKFLHLHHAFLLVFSLEMVCAIVCKDKERESEKYIVCAFGEPLCKGNIQEIN